MAENRGRNEGFRFVDEFVCEAIPNPSWAGQANGQPAKKRAPRKLFTVAGLFTVENRGTILAPGLTPEPDENFRIGDPIHLRRPDGSEIRVGIRGLDFFHPGPNGEWAVLVAVPESDVPIGTEVWST